MLANVHTAVQRSEIAMPRREDVCQRCADGKVKPLKCSNIHDMEAAAENGSHIVNKQQ